ncbi:MAG: hypothetical protein WB421_15365 [Terriglobales bacterium]|jgi:hypothetical protein
MRVVTSEEVRASFARNADFRCDGKDVYYTDSTARCIQIEYPPGEGQLVYLARLVAALGYEERYFRGATLWITLWGVWDSRVEAVAFKAVERFRAGYGEARSLEVAPGHFFRDDEFVDAVALLVQPMIVGWDAYYVPQWAYGGVDYFVHVSHDSYLTVVTRTEERYKETLETLKSFKWATVREIQRERFCRSSETKPQ